MATDVRRWIVMVTGAVVVATCVIFINGVIIAYGGIAAFIATLAMLAAARVASPNSWRTDNPDRLRRGFMAIFTADLIGIPVLISHLRLVAVIGWILLNRTTFGRRTFAVGGNPRPPAWRASASRGRRSGSTPYSARPAASPP